MGNPDEPNYSQAYVNQVCGSCNGTGKEAHLTRIETSQFPDAQQAYMIEECKSCGGAGWKTYGHR
jgi:DnaJ-class molecular chaperone